MVYNYALIGLYFATVLILVLHVLWSGILNSIGSNLDRFCPEKDMKIPA